MVHDVGSMSLDTTEADLFVGSGADDTVSYAGAARAVRADLSVGSAYKLLRILPFGDSITYGVIGSTTDTESGGYRTYMQERLGALDVAVDMVGSLRSGPDGIDLDHEGRRGWTLNQLNEIDAQVLGTHRPDAVLLMAGTNDSARDSSTMMIADLRALILSITDAAPDVTLFVASVPPVRVGQQSTTRAARVDAYNDKMPALIAELAAAGRDVHFVGMRGLTTADISAPPTDSGLHPNAQGYSKIANYWLDALKRDLGLAQGVIGVDQDRFDDIENLIGSAFDDALTGDAGANRLAGGGGDDLIDGGAGEDVAILSGRWRDYLVETGDGFLRVADRRGEAADGEDAFERVERFAFADGVFDATAIANDAPVATGDAAEVQAGGLEAASGDLLANDADPDSPLGDAVRVTGVRGSGPFADLSESLTLEGVYGTLTVMADGAFAYALDGERPATRALAADERAADVFSYRVADLAGATDVAELAIAVIGAGAGLVAPMSPLYARAGTQDGSAAADQRLAGPAGANSFYFDVGVRSGVDRVELFEKADILLVSSALPDGNGDGVIALGADGVLDFDGAGGSTDAVTLGGVGPTGLRYLGARDGLFVYAAAATRPAGATEGGLGDDRLSGDSGDVAEQTFLLDTALDVGFGRDQIERFGARDILVTTAALPDGNRDRIIDFGTDRVLNLPTGALSLISMSGSAHRRLEFDSSVERDGTVYFVYSLVGSQAGLADLDF